ncbi:type I restriction endonuclease subunit R, EcoR124 family [Mycoplasmopsis adleri]|uniref:type I restriction endonuclease subunit R, EcoR124 family n=1 Tax=Mycoplasmopsis adleri TaxID=51362 RepID=UPI003872FA6E
MIDKLKTEFPLGEQIQGNSAKELFAKTFGQILYLLNILKVFTEEWTPDKQILTDREMQDYQSFYLDIKDEFDKRREGEAVSILDDVVFEIELVKANDVDFDYILSKIKEAHNENMSEQEMTIYIDRIVRSSYTLRNKDLLIKAFLNVINLTNDYSNLPEQFDKFVSEDKEKQIDNLINKFNLKPEEAKKFIQNAIRDNELNSYGTKFTNIFKPMSMFDKSDDTNREGLKAKVSEEIQKLIDLYNE